MKFKGKEVISEVNAVAYYRICNLSRMFQILVQNSRTSLEFWLVITFFMLQ